MNTYHLSEATMNNTKEPIPENKQHITTVASTLKNSWDSAMEVQVMLENIISANTLETVSKEDLIRLHISHCEITRKLVEYVDDSLSILLNIE